MLEGGLVFQERVLSKSQGIGNFKLERDIIKSEKYSLKLD